MQVRDHGTGIDPADLPYVFDRFFRGANSRGIARAAVWDWRSSARSRCSTADPSTAANAPDGGAMFTLQLPIVSEDHVDRADDAYPVAGDPLSLR